MADIGQRIKTERASRKWTQQDLAYHAGLSIRTIASLESGIDSRLSTLAAVAKAFGLDVHELLAVEAAS